MNEFYINKGMERLEAINSEFNYDIAVQYVHLAKQYLKNVSNLDNQSPFFNICNEFDITLPETINLRLETFFNIKTDYSPTTRKVCKWYLIDQYVIDLSKNLENNNIYEPLIKILELGGDFYEHHAALCIRDAAMLPFKNAL